MELHSLIKIYYYKEIDFLACVQKIFKKGVSACTDPYSYYLNEEEVKEEKIEMIAGEFGGIGVVFEMKKDSPGATIMRVEDASPARKAGLLPGDLIVAVSSAAGSPDWVYLKDLDSRSASRMIRGPVGTKIMLKIIRDKIEKDFVVIREIVKIKVLESKKIGQVGYLKIKEFSGKHLANDVKDVLKNFQKENTKIVIIDLRYNSGGLLNLVLEITSFFAKKENNPIIFTKNRQGVYEGLSTDPGGEFKDFKLIVLQNEYSASASEILSGYLKAECGAMVIGKTSFGKGVVQRLFPLSEGELHLTTAEYFIGKNMVAIHGIGVKPSIEVANPKKVKSEINDLQLQRALQEAEKLSKQK